MKFTGERYIPTEDGKIRLEHYHRYAVVLDLVAGKDILDIASGEGYGSFLMADTARTVLGVDISDEAVLNAKNSYSSLKDNLNFSVGSAIDLDLEDNSFDVVVSFETIEHLAEQNEMLAELRRVLKPDGVLVMSSPNRPIYSEESGEHNEFHVKELDFSEFDQLLHREFDAVNYYGQRIMMGSLIKPIAGESATYQAWSDDGASFKAGTGAALQEPVYFLAVCSSVNVELPIIPSSSAYPEQSDLVKHYVGFAKWAQSLEKEALLSNERIYEQQEQLSDFDREIRNLQNEFSTQLGHLQHELKAQASNLESIITERDEIITERDEAITRIHGSLSWRVTAPMRELSRWGHAPKSQLKRYYNLLPLSSSVRALNRSFLSKFAPEMLIPEVNLPPGFEVRELRRNLDPESIVLATSDSPSVSVIIPVYGQLDYTLQCLLSITEHLPSIPFEVIVVDDCSPDDSAAQLEKVHGIVLIKNEKNLGFIGACNTGANNAKGQYCLFLNNDTEVTEGWMTALIDTFVDFPGTGFVGSKLVYPDGRLQEAGGIIWQDGNAWNFGRLQDPQLPLYNYAREVDYCSGASIMVPRFLFEKLGGFDAHYTPAYCEDADLALKIREQGYRVIYQPLSTVIHYEGITSGTDVNGSGAKSYQIENMKKMFTRWEDRLSTHQLPGEMVDQAKDRMATRRALVIDHCTPTPDQDAGSVIVYNQVLLLREMGFQVTFIAEDNFLYMPAYTDALQKVGIEVLYGPYNYSVEEHLKESGSRYDLAFLYRPGVMERHAKTIRRYCTSAKILFSTVDLHFLRMEREAELDASNVKRKAAAVIKDQEYRAIESADATIVHSTVELELLRKDFPQTNIHVFPLILDVTGSDVGFAARKDVVFVGGYNHAPNVDAVKHFVADIMPGLRARLPGVRFHAVGSNAPAEIEALACDDVLITGFVKDLGSLLDTMRVSVAPIRFGAGIKGKVGSAMSAGLPVVASSVAVEGMSLTNGHDVLVGDSATDSIDWIVRLYEDEQLWQAISTNALEFSERHWGIYSAWNNLSNILASIQLDTELGDYPLSLHRDKKISGARIPRYEAKPLNPVASLNHCSEAKSISAITEIAESAAVEASLLKGSQDSFTVEGYCSCCDAQLSLLVDMDSGGSLQNETWTPNWRERLECSSCGMNNRQRLMFSLVAQLLCKPKRQKVYFMEQVTPIYAAIKNTFSQHEVIGSEYLGFEYESGEVVKGLRHEDVEALSFESGELDLIVSNDVFEHVPNPVKAFSECARVLADDGVMLATIPFYMAEEKSVRRATITPNGVENILPAMFHGNPISDEGSLVFTDFGWDMLADIEEAGFAQVTAEIYSSVECGHLGGGQIVFRASKVAKRT